MDDTFCSYRFLSVIKLIKIKAVLRCLRLNQCSNHHVIPNPEKGTMDDEEWEQAKIKAKKAYFEDQKLKHPNYIPILSKKSFEDTLFNGEYSCISVGLNPEELKQMQNLSEKEREKQLGKLYEQKINALKDDLDQLGIHYTEVVGDYGEEEPSFMISHTLKAKCENEDNSILVEREPNRDDVIKALNKLGKKYNQESVAHVKKGQMEWHFVTGEHEGKKGVGKPNGTSITKKKNLFSEARLGDEDCTKWSCNMKPILDKEGNVLAEKLIDNPLK